MSRFSLSNPSYLAAAALFCSKDKTRYYLNGVLIEPHPETGVLMVATDGHRMICFHDRDGNTDGKYIVQVSKHLASCIKYNAKNPISRLDATDDTIRLYKGDELHDILMLHLIDGEFTNWRGVVPNPFISDVPADSFNSALLADFHKVATTAHGKAAPTAIKIVSFGTQPALILPDEAQHWFGILMPMRSGITTQIPFSVADPDAPQSEAAE